MKDSSNTPSRQATFLGADLSTTALSVGVRGANGDEDFVSIEMVGATCWHDQPGFHLEHLPLMMSAALEMLQQRAWHFGVPGSLSFSVRQHDMVLLDRTYQPLLPSLSWECHVAQQEVVELEQLGIDREVGPIAPRFILPKLLWTLRQESYLADRIEHVVTTGDFIAARLTGQLALSASDALSNALLDQSSKKLAKSAIAKTPIRPSWFPDVVASGSVVGQVGPVDDDDQAWVKVRDLMPGWSVSAGLGDNHASAVGCGLADPRTIVISAGSSGTIVRACAPSAKLAGNANCFEFYDDRLLLFMLADCAIWYNRFLEEWLHGSRDHAALNEAACGVEVSRIQQVTQIVQNGVFCEQYPEGFRDLDWPEQLASTQFSIALELLRLVGDMLGEVQDTDAAIERCVLTGGLCQSSWFRWVLHAGLSQLVPAAKVRVSARNDKLAFQSATYGALVNAMIQGDYASLPRTIEQLCPQRDCDVADSGMANALAALVAHYLKSPRS